MNLKIGFLGLFLMSMTAPALANTLGEAQFIGKISKITNITDGCNIKIDTFSYYTMSGMHPLFQEDVLGQDVFLSTGQCDQLEVGAEISGILVADEKGIVLEN